MEAIILLGLFFVAPFLHFLLALGEFGVSRGVRV